MNTETTQQPAWATKMLHAKSPEEMLIAFLMGAPINQDFIDAQKKLYEECAKQNPWLN
jgi:hypothetical protein